MRFKRTLCLLLCALTVCLTVCTGGRTLKAEAASVDKYKEQLAAAQAKSAELKKEIAALKAENAPYEKQKAALQKQINATQAEIDLYNEQIEETTDAIAECEAEVAATKDLLKERLVAIYTSGDNSALNVLLSANDFGEYLAKAQLMRSVTDYDREVIEKFNESITELNQSKAVLDDAKAAVAVKQAELTVQYDEVNAIVLDKDKEIAALNAKLKSQQETERDIKEAIEKEQNSGSSGNVNATGKFTWPVPGKYGVSSYFGYRWGRQHQGIDISQSGIYGSKIVAADAGKVTLSKYYGGYGYTVMVDHQNGYVTLYAHMKSASPVKVGSYVKKGQTIGYVGSTGNSTGPHLHFEIRKNGVAKNPVNWF